MQSALVLPIHNPRALFRHFDLLPKEIWGPPGVMATSSAAHVQNYVCSIVHHAYSYLHSANLEDVACVLVPHTCDSLQGLASQMMDFETDLPPIFSLYLPRGQRASDFEFFTAELRKLADKMASRLNKVVDEEKLMQCVLREEQADALLATLYETKSSLTLTDREFYTTVRSRGELTAEEFIARVETILSQKTPMNQKNSIPIILSGIVPEPPELFDFINGLNAHVAGDDLACGSRRLYPPGKSADPFQRMAESLLSGPPDSTRGHSIRERTNYLLDLCQKHSARGVIFYGMKFCEPELFDIPILTGILKMSGIQTLELSTDIGDSLSHQNQTRIEAFIEMLT